jgi:uncharacterized protein
LRIPHEILSRALGIFLIAYIIFIISNQAYKLSQKLSVAISGGALTGFCAGIFGIGGKIIAVALSAFNLEKAVYISTAGAISLVIDSTRITTYIKGGAGLEPHIMLGLLIFVPISLFGAIVGKKRN